MKLSPLIPPSRGRGRTSSAWFCSPLTPSPLHFRLSWLPSSPRPRRSQGAVACCDPLPRTFFTGGCFSWFSTVDGRPRSTSWEQQLTAIQIRRNEFLFCFSFIFSLILGGNLLGWTMFTGISTRADERKKGRRWNFFVTELAFAI